ncbi:dynein light chain [Echinococcus multilocularis]|uniref:Dynein light chain n=1 Tax=Echinococcus multilocularis TaxID=6211 RepID=A0A068YJ38_ECHMU|nr:dynein light chain [Echinococcus multilocularis]
MSGERIINIQTDMTDDRRQDMEQIVADAAQTSGLSNIQAIASTVKSECDSRYGGNWHCHVGDFFGSSFPYEANTYFYAEMSNICVLVYKYL